VGGGGKNGVNLDLERRDGKGNVTGTPKRRVKQKIDDSRFGGGRWAGDSEAEILSEIDKDEDEDEDEFTDLSGFVVSDGNVIEEKEDLELLLVFFVMQRFVGPEICSPELSKPTHSQCSTYRALINQPRSQSYSRPVQSRCAS